MGVLPVIYHNGHYNVKTDILMQGAMDSHYNEAARTRLNVSGVICR